MAFQVFFDVVENSQLQTKSVPWLCDKCRKKDSFLIKMQVDYDTLVLCKKCLMGCKKLITDKEKERRGK
jgi:hypothetical protein